MSGSARVNVYIANIVTITLFLSQSSTFYLLGQALEDAKHFGWEFGDKGIKKTIL